MSYGKCLLIFLYLNYDYYAMIGGLTFFIFNYVSFGIYIWLHFLNTWKWQWKQSSTIQMLLYGSSDIMALLLLIGLLYFLPWKLEDIFGRWRRNIIQFLCTWWTFTTTPVIVELRAKQDINTSHQVLKSSALLQELGLPKIASPNSTIWAKCISSKQKKTQVFELLSYGMCSE